MKIKQAFEWVLFFLGAVIFAAALLGPVILLCFGQSSPLLSWETFVAISSYAAYMIMFQIFLESTK